MKIVLFPRDSSPGTLFFAAEAVVMVTASAVAVYFFMYRENWLHVAISAFAALLTLGILILNESWPRLNPVILIDDQGIHDRRLSFGCITWSDILEAQIETNGPLLSLRVKDPEKYVRLLPADQQLKYRQRQSLGFNMLYLDVRGLQGDLLLILELIQKKISGS